MKEVLKLDIDISDFAKVVSIIKNRCSVFNIFREVRPVGCEVRSTKHGYHVYLDVEGVELTSFDVCFLQMALGSDYKRETFNFMRFRHKLGKEWNVLFEKKMDGNHNILSQEIKEPVLSSVLWNEIKDRVSK